MAAYQVKRSIEINQPISVIRDYLKNFRNWQAWSPWLIQESSATLTYTGEQGELDSGYAWEGKRIGVGSMLLTHITDDKLDMKLRFLKPFKSKAKVSFALTKLSNDHTQVTWVMESKLPFFLFFLKKMMVGMISMDYDRGLAMLKSQLETGEVLSKLKLVGERQQETMHYVGVACKCTLQQMADTWEGGMARLEEALAVQDIQTTGTVFALYQSMDISTTETEFLIGMPVEKQTLKKAKKPLQKGSIKACSTYVVEHTGAYEHVGNAWAMAYSASRADKIKVKHKNPTGMEIYLNDPENTEKKELLTEVVLFKK